MTTPPRSPELLKGRFALPDRVPSVVRRTIPQQYDPDTLTRSFEIQSAGGEGGARTEDLRLTEPPRETVQIEVVLGTLQAKLPRRCAGVHQTAAVIYGGID